MTKRRKKRLKPSAIVGYSFLGLYAVAAIAFLMFCLDLNMLPVMYIIIEVVVLAVLGVLFAIMQRKFSLSVISDMLCFIFSIGLFAGCYFIYQTGSTISNVASTEAQTNVISVYVMDDDPAQSLQEIADYQFGISATVDRENTDNAISSLRDQLGSELSVSEYEDLFTMVDDLRSGRTGAVIINSAYLGIVSDVEGYSWVLTDLREVSSVALEVADAGRNDVPDDVPETFVMYLSGIDTYGGISARSRSDVNILAVVNTRTKNILLLSTPRDYYVDYSVTGGAKDKLTHAGIYGIDASMDALERLYDIDIDYYLRVNFTGFIDIIDALGGVDVYSEYDFSVENIRSYQQGYNHLTGLEALAFARERYSFAEGDYQRADNQMEVIRAVIAKCASSSLLTNYTSVMRAVAGSFDTNMPEDQIASLVRMQLADMSSWDINSYTVSGESASAETYSMPGQNLYVIIPDESDVNNAKEMISEVYGTNDESSGSNETAQ